MFRTQCSGKPRTAGPGHVFQSPASKSSARGVASRGAAPVGQQRSRPARPGRAPRAARARAGGLPEARSVRRSSEAQSPWPRETLRSTTSALHSPRRSLRVTTTAASLQSSSKASGVMTCETSLPPARLTMQPDGSQRKQRRCGQFGGPITVRRRPEPRVPARRWKRAHPARGVRIAITLAMTTRTPPLQRSGVFRRHSTTSPPVPSSNGPTPNGDKAQKAHGHHPD
jgi:hypothetical protein